MANHVIYDRIWESRKLARCSRDAALAYPSIFLVADDWGRFEYNPRRIWTKVFGNRDDVSLEEVTAWLDEYWRVGLLLRYHIDGDLAYWYKFKGRRPSERRPSEHADPTGIPEVTPPAETPRENRGEIAEESRPDRVPQTNSPAPELDQNGSEQSRTESANLPAREPLPHDLSSRPWLDRPEPLVEGRRPELELEWLRLVRELVELTGEPPESIAPSYNGRSGLNPADLTPKRLLRDLIDLRRRRAALEPKVATAAGPPPEERELADRHQDLASEFLAWYRLHPEAGEFGGRSGMLGVAYGAWPRGNQLPAWVSDLVRRTAQQFTAQDERAS